MKKISRQFIGAYIELKLHFDVLAYQTMYCLF